jgi:putative PIN family toxin of toxin-antitoxin system
MLAVVDTNVWVSAFLTPGGASAKVLDSVKLGRLVPAFSDAVVLEYRDVLGRPKFGIQPELVAEFLARLHEAGRHVEPILSPMASTLPDPAEAIIRGDPRASQLKWEVHQDLRDAGLSELRL